MKFSQSEGVVLLRKAQIHSLLSGLQTGYTFETTLLCDFLRLQHLSRRVIGVGENFTVVEKTSEKTSASWRKLHRRGENLSVVEKSSPSWRKLHRRGEKAHRRRENFRVVEKSSPSWRALPILAGILWSKSLLGRN